MRTIAILAVVAYHINLPSVSGGYVGVDIFFVISGFLIIGQLASSIAVGRFNLLQFFARRVLRILPPFFLVLLVTLCAGALGLFFGFELKRLGFSGMAAAVMAANFYYFFNSGYFGLGAAAEPFLHTWTLSVEEQFYLGAPIFILTVAYFVRRRASMLAPLAIAMAVMLVISLATCIVLTWLRRDFAFYMPITRSWEFTAGGLLAVVANRGFQLSKRMGAVAAWAGMALMILAIVWFSDDTPFPGWAAGIPVFGAVLVLAAGLANRTSIPIRLLTTRPATLIGLASYSWYLWHWPVLYLARTRLGEAAWIDLAAAGLSLFLAFATYFAMERPLASLRHSAFVRTYAGRIVLGGVVASFLVAGFAFVIERVGEADVRGPEAEILSKVGKQSYSDCRSQSVLNSRLTCLVGGDDTPSLIVWGDSYAGDVVPGVDSTGKELGKGALVVSNYACPPLAGWHVYAKGIRLDRCDKDNELTLQTIRQRAAQSDVGVVLVARWMLYSGKSWPNVFGQHSIIRPADNPDAAFPSFQAEIKAALSHTLDVLVASGVRRILLVGPHPEMRMWVPECLLRIGLDSPWRDACGVKRQAMNEWNAPFLGMVHDLLQAYPQLRFIDPNPVLCDDSVCRPYDGADILYWDSHHLTYAGAVKLDKPFADEFRWLFGNS